MSRRAPPRRFHGVVVTGLSGAGKTVALRALEDAGYFCVDNLPLPLLPDLLSLYRQWGRRIDRVAVGVDVRTDLPRKVFLRSLDLLRRAGYPFRVLFMDADAGALLRRFSETRRRHPLGGPVIRGIRRERALFRDIKALADQVIDTSRLTPPEAKEIVASSLGLRDPRGMGVSICSFGYKYGLPLDADVVWDVRFLPNPHYDRRLRPLTGRQAAVARYVLDNPAAGAFLKLAKEMLSFLVDRFDREGKSYFTLAVGCTGGRHRSVAVAEALGAFLRKGSRRRLQVRHRDVER